MARTFDFFNSTGDFKQVVPGIESSTSLTYMQASHERSKKKIINVITQAQYDKLKTAYLGTPTTEEQAAIDELQGAHGNMIAYFEIVSKIIHKKKEEVSYYKYEIQLQQENYLDSFATFMDSLLDYMDANAGSFADWVASDAYILRQSLVLKTANDFNKKIPTGGSAYFFNLIAPLQNKVIVSEVTPRGIDTTAIEAKVKTDLEYFVAYRTMADALCLVDYADLPKSMRQKLYVDESKKKGKEMEDLNKYYCDKFNAEANNYLSRIDICLQTTDDMTDISVPEENFNCEDDKTYVIS